MLNIHSFLQKNKEKSQSLFMISSYVMAGAILILSSDCLYPTINNSNVVYAKTGMIVDVFEKTKEETAKEATIQAEEKKEVPKVILNFENQITPEKEIKLTSGIELEKEITKKSEKEKTAKKEKTTEKSKTKKKAKVAKKQKTVQLSNSEKQVLQRIVEAEATGEDIKGKMLVANVILNRKNSKQFPDTVKGVVFQKNGNVVQFSPTKDGRYWSVSVTKESKEAVERVLSGEDYSKGALYFSARSRADKRSMSWFDRNLKWLFKYHGHEFYTNK